MRRFLYWLLRLTHPPDDASAILGDLEEEYRAQRRTRRRLLAAQSRYFVHLLQAAIPKPRSAGCSPSGRRSLRADLDYAVRRSRRRPAFAGAVVATLALGIGSATAVFSVVDAVLLRPLPWQDGDRLVAIFATRPSAIEPERQYGRFGTAADGWRRRPVSREAWAALRSDPVFAAVAVWESPDTMLLGEEGRELVAVTRVSSGLLEILGVPIARGRGFSSAEDDDPSDVAVITHAAWQSRFGGSPDVVGSVLHLSHVTGRASRTVTVVGVSAPGFPAEADRRVDLLLPVGERRSVHLVARLAPGVSMQTASAAVERVVENAMTRDDTSARVIPLSSSASESSAPMLWWLLAGSGVLLLVACANVTGLLLSEGQARQHEIALRAALGAGRWQLLRQLAVEHILLASIAAVLGLVSGVWLVEGLIGWVSIDLHGLSSVGMSWRVVAFALTVGVATLLLSGLAPASFLLRQRSVYRLAQEGRDGASTRRLGQRTVVSGVVALTIVLLVTASLLGETMYRLTSQPLGFDPSDLVVVSTWTVGEGAPARHLDRALVAELLGRAAAVPGVTDVAITSAVPLLGQGTGVQLLTSGGPTGEFPVHMQVVSHHYFDVVGMPVLRGRGFQPGDEIAASVAVVSTEFERRYLDGAALGRRFAWGGGRQVDVVGVVPDITANDLKDERPAAFYVLDGSTGGSLHLVARTTGDVAAVLSMLRQAADAAPSIVVRGATTLADELSRDIALERFRAALSAVFGGGALMLAVVGLYSLVARQVDERRPAAGASL